MVKIGSKRIGFTLYPERRHLRRVMKFCKDTYPPGDVLVFNDFDHVTWVDGEPMVSVYIPEDVIIRLKERFGKDAL